MEGDRIFDSCPDMLALPNNPNNSLWIPPSSFHDTMVNFDEEPQRRRANPRRGLFDTAFGSGYEGEDTGGEESDAHPNTRSEKKRRLASEQVEFLEKSFVKDNKLDPERKEKLAKQLGLQSKQVAIWFQNRRARYKTKQIEKEFDTLKASYDRLKDDYDSLIMEKEQLQAEVDTLKKKLEQKEIKENNSSPKNTSHSEKGMSITEPYDDVQEIGFKELVLPSNKTAEDASSAKSDVLDYESPNWTDANQACSLIEASSAFVHGPDQKSIGIGPDQQSADEEEHFMMSKNLLLPKTPPTFNDDDDPSGSSCNFSLVEDQPFWSSWLY